jgi:hypothetical protein
LVAIFEAAGAPPCKQCKADAATMNRMGTAWCREHVDELVERIGKRVSKLGLWTSIKVGFNVFTDPTLPNSIRGNVLLAIERAEAKAR